MKTEAEINIENTRPEGYISNRELVVPSLLPFLSEEQITKPVLKRNETLIETHLGKINSKRIEETFGPSIFIDTEQLLEEWSDLFRNADGSLSCTNESIIPVIFETFRIIMKENNLDEDITVPIFQKPRTLRGSYAMYRDHQDQIRTLYQEIIN